MGSLLNAQPELPFTGDGIAIRCRKFCRLYF